MAAPITLPISSKQWKLHELSLKPRGEQKS